MENVANDATAPMLSVTVSVVRELVPAVPSLVVTGLIMAMLMPSDPLVGQLV